MWRPRPPSEVAGPHVWQSPGLLLASLQLLWLALKGRACSALETGLPLTAGFSRPVGSRLSAVSRRHVTCTGRTAEPPLLGLQRGFLPNYKTLCGCPSCDVLVQSQDHGHVLPGRPTASDSAQDTPCGDGDQSCRPAQEHRGLCTGSHTPSAPGHMCRQHRGPAFLVAPWVPSPDSPAPWCALFRKGSGDTALVSWPRPPVGCPVGPELGAVRTLLSV